MAVQHVFSNAVADGTVTSIVRPSDWNSYHNQLLTIAGNTSGQSIVSGTNIAFQGGNNVTLSASTAAGAATIVISGGNTSQFLTTAMQSNAGSNFVAATAAFAGTNASGTIASNGISVSVQPPPSTTQFLTTAMQSNAGSNFVAATAAFAGTNASGTIASNGISVSVQPPPSTTQFLTTAMQSDAGSNFVAATAAFAGTNASGTIASNGISVSVQPPPSTTQFLTTAMQSNAGSNFVAATAVFAGTNASGTIASDGISISVAPGGGGEAVTQNFWMPNQIMNNTSFLVPGQNTIYMQHLHPAEPIAISNAEFNCLHSFVSSSNSQSVGMTVRYGLYEQGSGASSQSIQSIGTSSMFMRASYNSSTAAGFTCGQGANSFTVTSNNSNLFGTALSGPKFLYLPFTTTLAANKEYFWAMQFSSTTAVNTGPMRFNMMVQTNINSTVWGELKMTTYVASATNQWEEYDGAQYSVTSSNLPANVNSTQLQMMASKGRLLMIFENE